MLTNAHIPPEPVTLNNPHHIIELGAFAALGEWSADVRITIIDRILLRIGLFKL